MTNHDERLKGLVLRGMWFDKFRYVDGRVESGPHGTFEWRPNQIQNRMATLLAALCKGEAGFSRIGFMAYGEGLVGWDTTPPVQDPDNPVLQTESFRKVIAPADIIFIDPITNIPTGGTPSPKLEIVTVLSSAEANGQSLREFALFGGTATVSLGTGDIVNWVVHARIDKDSSFEIDRTIRLEFVTV